MIAVVLVLAGSVSFVLGLMWWERRCDIRAWNIVMNPNSCGEKLRRARERVRRQAVVRDAMEKYEQQKKAR
jgi:hypothetical protein